LDEYGADGAFSQRATAWSVRRAAALAQLFECQAPAGRCGIPLADRTAAGADFASGRAPATACSQGIRKAVAIVQAGRVAALAGFASSPSSDIELFDINGNDLRAGLVQP